MLLTLRITRERLNKFGAIFFFLKIFVEFEGKEKNRKNYTEKHTSLYVSSLYLDDAHIVLSLALKPDYLQYSFINLVTVTVCCLL